MNKLCAIVGAGDGLGAALAAKFASEGYDVALVSRTESGSADAKAAAEKAGAKTQFFAADANTPNTVEAALKQVAADMGQIDILIYNVRDKFERIDPLEMTYDGLEQIHRVEVVGAFAAAKAVLPDMRARGTGQIFFSSSTAAFRGSAKVPLYSIAKFGLRALSQSLAKAYAGDGVHIVHVRLDCDLDTPIMKEMYGDAYENAKLTDPADVAETYWLTAQQPKGAWSNEIEIRPYTEGWTY